MIVQVFSDIIYFLAKVKILIIVLLQKPVGSWQQIDDCQMALPQ